MTRKTIAGLEAELTRAIADNNYHKKAWLELKEKQDREIYVHSTQKFVYDECKEQEIRRLMEIIRILWKDERLKFESIDPLKY